MVTQNYERGRCRNGGAGEWIRGGRDRSIGRYTTEICFDNDLSSVASLFTFNLSKTYASSRMNSELQCFFFGTFATWLEQIVLPNCFEQCVLETKHGNLRMLN